MNALFVNNIFKQEKISEDFIKELFRYQYEHNSVYQNWCRHLNVTPGKVETILQRPFLPVSFFKTHTIVTGDFIPEAVFESSGTTTTINSKHFVKDAALYKQSFTTAFEMFYGSIKDWCILALLPSYLERNNSSLIMMADELIKLSGNEYSGFYLYEFDKLASTLQQMEAAKQKTLLLGVTFALLDFAEQYEFPLLHTIIMETGGMKGRKEEITRAEVHEILTKSFGAEHIHSEYGMTELLSQAYAKKDGCYYCPPWMKVLVRDEQDPLAVKTTGRGLLNIIDLANIHSCAFIATDDAGIVYEDGSFEVLGRADNSDLRGCSLLAI